jgi:arginase
MADVRGIDVLGVPSSMGAFAPGQERAPAALRAAGLFGALRESGTAVRDLGDLPIRRWRPDRARPEVQNLEAVVEVARLTAARIADSAREGRTTLVLGGDCTVALGTVAGHLAAAERVGLVYLDLHPDLNVPSSTMAGALDWMGMAHALGVEGAEPALVVFGPRTPLLDGDDVVFLAHGSGTDAEQDVMARRGLRGITVERTAADPEAAAAEALTALAHVERLLVHLDIDVIDFNDLPLSENTGRGEGLSFDSTVRALGVLLADPRLRALSIGEVNPDHDPDGTAILRFARAIADSLILQPARS